MSYSLGILDQSPIFPNTTSTDALRSTIDLVKDAEKWGYSRFWVSEHHNMEIVAGTSPEILMSHLLAHTNSIRIGSGGVMLQHYSPYKVVENFHVLSALAPGRVDLGVGKAAGGFDLSTKALQFGRKNDASDFEERLLFTKQLVDQTIPEDHPFAKLKAKPEPIVKPEIYLLGASDNSAKLAAERKVDFAFARFINSNDEELQRAAATFKANHPEGKLLVAIAVLAAETRQEALDLAEDIALYQVTFPDGRTNIVQSYAQVEDLKKQTTEKFEVSEKELSVIAGTAEQVKAVLDEFHALYGIDEFILHTPIQQEKERRASFERLSPKNLGLKKGLQKEKITN